MKIGMVVPTWGKQCGVAEYTKQIIDHTGNESIQFIVYSEMEDDFAVNIHQDSVEFVHFQHEYSIYELNHLYDVMINLQQRKIPVITTLHSWNRELIPHNLLVSSFSSKIIVHSDEMKELCIRHGFDPEKFVVMPIGCQSFPLEAKEKTTKLFNIAGYPRIGFFGFPFPHKGILTLIEALNELKVYFPEIKGYFFSHYPNYLDEKHAYYSFFQELGSQFKNQDHIVWSKGYLPESTLVNLLHCMDINVLPYKQHSQQGISAAVKLLLAARRPIVSTDYLYFSDLENEVYKMQDTEVDTIVSSLCTLLMDDTLQERLIANGNEYLEKNDWVKIGKSYQELYQKFIANAGEKPHEKSINNRNYRICRKSSS